MGELLLFNFRLIYSLWGWTPVSIIHCDWCQWDIDPQCCFYHSLGSAEGFNIYRAPIKQTQSFTNASSGAIKCPFRVRICDIKHYLSFGLNFGRSQRRHGWNGNGLLDTMKMNHQCLWAMHWVCLAHSIRMHFMYFSVLDINPLTFSRLKQMWKRRISFLRA